MIGQLGRLSVCYGTPKGQTPEMTQVMIGEWLTALQGVLPRDLDAGVTRWIAREKWWPRVSEVKALADMPRHDSQKPARGALHPERYAGSGEGLTRSLLRSNSKWSAWLDSIHPYHEHHFFARAQFGDYASTIVNLTKFEAETIWDKWGGELQELLAGNLKLIPDLSLVELRPARKENRTFGPDEIERRKRVCEEARKKFGWSATL